MTKTKFRRILSVVFVTACILLTVISFAALFAARWYITVYGQIGFDSVLYTLFSGLNGMDFGLIRSFLRSVLPKTLLCSGVVSFLLFFPAKKEIFVTLFRKLRLRLFPVWRPVSFACSILLCGIVLFAAAKDVELDKYIISVYNSSAIFETQYQDPKTVPITFPEEKRNLIYIFLESMEISFMSDGKNGMLPYDTIPELTALAQENINFSHNENVGGFYTLNGAGMTVGSMVAQTAGIPLKTPPGIDGNGYGQDGNFLPGVTNLTNILHENGYYQALMVGSDAAFGGRKQYYTQHGIDRIYDIHTARADGIVPQDYQVWWGMEDKHLFTYAQQELTKIAAKDQPFAMTLLTVDTHHVGGYLCDLCESTYEEQYENVMACSSRQVDAFVQWLKQQDYYENTTVVIVGDHASMDNEYFQRNSPEGYERTVYNCIINAPVQPVNSSNRIFCAMDMFPTTLAALGCTVEGDRLGLGTNLFSSTATLMEVVGKHQFEHEISLTSYYYMNHFFF